MKYIDIAKEAIEKGTSLEQLQMLGIFPTKQHYIDLNKMFKNVTLIIDEMEKKNVEEHGGKKLSDYKSEQKMLAEQLKGMEDQGIFDEEYLKMFPSQERGPLDGIIKSFKKGV